MRRVARGVTLQLMEEHKNMPKTERDFRKKLTEEQYLVMRQKGTEPPFSGRYVHEKADGMYSCAACNNPLFDSNTKFDSGTGWPSFDEAISGSITTTRDTEGGMVSTEVLCSRCGSHLGHLFDDGPTEKGKRYCINSVCLELEKKEKISPKPGA